MKLGKGITGLAIAVAALGLTGCSGLNLGGVFGDKPVTFTYNPDTRTLDGQIPVSIPVGGALQPAPVSANPQISVKQIEK